MRTEKISYNCAAQTNFINLKEKIKIENLVLLKCISNSLLMNSNLIETFSDSFLTVKAENW